MIKFKLHSYIILYSPILIFSSCYKEYEPVKKIDYYSEIKNRSDLSKLIETEIDQNRKPVLYFYADWCGPCRRFKASLTDPLMRETMKDATLIMIDGDIDFSEDTISSRYPIHGYPTFIRIDKTGNSIKQITSALWEEDIPKNIAPVMKEFLK